MGHLANILCTRPLDTALIQLAADNNIAIDVIPFIVTEPVRDKRQAGQIQSLAMHQQVAIFTSVNAVEAVAGLLQQQVRKKRRGTMWSGPDPSGQLTGASGQLTGPSGEPLPWKIFCISGATRQRVQELFGEDTIVGTAPSAGKLADVILEPGHRHYKGSYFFYCGDLRRRELHDRLYKEAAIYLNEYVVYRTIEMPHKIETPYDGIAFFSPSAVESFFSLNAVPAVTTLFAIGHTTADAIRTHGPNPVIVSPSPEQATLVRKIIEHFQKNI
ncbi:MAG TPA: uroporphyrinogen-III synthase [Puia sp.]|nr:uroporphyrinogen-III synthase [Puia sp.]